MRIAIGNDHAAVEAKRAIVDRLKQSGHQVDDLGAVSIESVDYPDPAALVARAVARGDAQLGILICGTGIGVSIAANKIRGVRAALCHSDATARLSREHNDANVLCMGARVLSLDVMSECVDAFLTTDFAGGRHIQRVEKIRQLEDLGQDKKKGP